MNSRKSRHDLLFGRDKLRSREAVVLAVPLRETCRLLDPRSHAMQAHITASPL